MDEPLYGKFVDGTSPYERQDLVDAIRENVGDQFLDEPEEAPSIPAPGIAAPIRPMSNLAPPLGCDDAVTEVGLLVSDLTAAIAGILGRGEYDGTAITDAVAALATGHLILTGPPGTGKSRLARELASAYNARLVVHTANPEWSVYDTIGSLMIRGTGEVTPRHGLITQTVIDCCSAVNEHINGRSDQQAVWLLIDELNRAEIDRAFGPLFTALADPASGEMVLDYMAVPTALRIPRRFRIIATLNSFDTRFVNSISAALRRRFARVAVLPPSNGEDGASPAREFALALDQAKALASITFERGIVEIAAEEIIAVSGDLRAFIGALRDSGELGGVPFGTAQVLDTCLSAIALLIVEGLGTGRAAKLVDRASASRLISALESDSTRVSVRTALIDHLKVQCPSFPIAVSRLEAFIRGRD